MDNFKLESGDVEKKYLALGLQENNEKVLNVLYSKKMNNLNPRKRKWKNPQIEFFTKIIIVLLSLCALNVHFLSTEALLTFSYLYKEQRQIVYRSEVINI